MTSQPNSRTAKGLPRYVGVKEVCAALGISRPTFSRMRDDGRFPPHEQISPNRVGWKVEVVEEHLSTQARSVTSLGVTNPEDLEPEQLEDQALDLAAHALSKRTGISVDPSDLSLQLTQR